MTLKRIIEEDVKRGRRRIKLIYETSIKSKYANIKKEGGKRTVWREHW